MPAHCNYSLAFNSTGFLWNSGFIFLISFCWQPNMTSLPQKKNKKKLPRFKKEKKVYGMFMCIFKWLFIHIRGKSGLILLLTFGESSSQIEWGKPFRKMMKQWHWLLLLYFICKNVIHVRRHWVVLFFFCMFYSLFTLMGFMSWMLNLS